MTGTMLRLGMTALAAVGPFALPGAAHAAPAAAPVTFAKDVAPIFQVKCQSCHEPGSIAPMSTVTFREARPWAKSIRARRCRPCRPCTRTCGGAR